MQQLKTHFRGHDASSKRLLAIKHEEHRCGYCGKLLGDRGSLERHVAAYHNKETRFDCANCDQKFYHKYMLVRHLKEKHNDSPPKCDVCGHEFSTYATLRRHAEDKHNVNIQQLECLECRKIFLSGLSYKKHMKKHATGGIRCICTICGMGLSSATSLKDHMTRRHNDETPFECKYCDRAFTTSLSLKTHQLTHVDPSFACNLCDKKFIQSASLRIHIKRVHIKVRPYSCDFCQKLFATRTELKKHRVRCKGPKSVTR